MIGIVVVTHGAIGIEMVKATRQIIPAVQKLEGVVVNSDQPPEEIRQNVKDAIQRASSPDGVLILTDMFGGTPSNICLSCLSNEKIEVISGFNLPMLIKLASLQNEAKIEEVVPFIKKYGQKNIVIANQILHGEHDNNE